MIQQPQQQQQQQVDLSKTTGLKCENCNGHFFDQTLLIRKISKFLSGTNEDAVTFVPVFVCRNCGDLLKQFFPNGMPDLEADLKLTKTEDSSPKIKLY